MVAVNSGQPDETPVPKLNPEEIFPHKINIKLCDNLVAAITGIAGLCFNFESSDACAVLAHGEFAKFTRRANTVQKAGEWVALYREALEKMLALLSRYPDDAAFAAAVQAGAEEGLGGKLQELAKQLGEAMGGNAHVIGGVVQRGG